MFQMVSFGTILDHFGLWAAAKGHSKVSPELSSAIRNSFGCVLYIPLRIAFVAYKRPPPWEPWFQVCPLGSQSLYMYWRHGFHIESLFRSFGKALSLAHL